VAGDLKKTGQKRGLVGTPLHTFDWLWVDHDHWAY